MSSDHYYKKWCQYMFPPIHTLFITILCSYVYFSDNNQFLFLPPTKYESWWVYPATLVSHFSNTHFISNIIPYIFFSSLLEIVHGSFTAFIVFWYSGLNGVLWEVSFFNSKNLTRYTGSSPSLYGIISSYLAHIVLNWNEAPLKYVWIIVLIVEVCVVVVSSIYDENYRQTVAHSSHIFGFVQGFLISLNTIRNLVLKKWEIRLQIVSFLISIILSICPIFIIYISY